MHYNAYICNVRIFLPIISDSIQDKAFTSLKGACNELNVDYSQAVRGKRKWHDKIIKEIEVIKQVRNAKA